MDAAEMFKQIEMGQLADDAAPKADQPDNQVTADVLEQYADADEGTITTLPNTGQEYVIQQAIDIDPDILKNAGASEDSVVYTVVDPTTNETQHVILPPGYQLVTGPGNELQMVLAEDYQAGGEAVEGAQLVEHAEQSGHAEEHFGADDAATAGDQLANLLKTVGVADDTSLADGSVVQTLEGQQAILDGNMIVDGALSTAGGLQIIQGSGIDQQLDPNEQYCLIPVDDGSDNAILIPLSQLDQGTLSALQASQGAVVEHSQAAETVVAQSYPTQKYPQSAPKQSYGPTPMATRGGSIATRTLIDPPPETEATTIKMRSGFQCIECPFESRCIKDIMRHVKLNHTTIRPYNCSACEYSDVDETGISEHISAEHPGISAQSMLCDSLLLGELKKIARTLYQCKIRSVSAFEQTKEEPGVKIVAGATGTVVQLEDGQAAVTLNDPYERIKNRFFCVQCRFSSSYYMNALAHVQSEHAFAYPYKCPYCYHESYDETATMQHVKVIHRQKAQGINIDTDLESQVGAWSKKEVVKGARLVLEMESTRSGRVVPVVPPGKVALNSFTAPRKITVYRCTKCAFQSKSEGSVRSHIRKSHIDAIQFAAFTCKHCGYMATDRVMVSEHTRMEHPGMTAEVYYDAKKPLELRDAVTSLFKVEVLDASLESAVEVTETGEILSSTLDIAVWADSSGYGPGYRRLLNKSRKFICNRCSFRTSGLQHIKSHVISAHTNYKPYTCLFCNFSMATHLGIIRHIQRFHKIENYKPGVNIDKKLLHSIDTEVVSSYTEIEGDSEGNEFALVGNLTDHSSGMPEASLDLTKIHEASTGGTGVKSTSEGLWACKFCKYASKSQRDVRLHVKRIHQEVRPYKCPLCTYTCSAGVSFILKHMAVRHPGEIGEVICNEEEAAEVERFAEDNVELVYPEMKNLQTVSEVLQEFREKGDSTRQIRLVKDIMGVDPLGDGGGGRGGMTKYRCMQCLVECSNETEIEQHVMLNHLTTTPYSCLYCGAQFKILSKAQLHIGEAHPQMGSAGMQMNEMLVKAQKEEASKHYACVSGARSATATSQAELGLFDDSYLDDEDDLPPIRREEYTFQCQKCSFTHKSITLAERHVMTQHEQYTPFTCKFCNYEFKAASELAVLEHVKESHQVADVDEMKAGVYTDESQLDRIRPLIQQSLLAVHDESGDQMPVEDLLTREELGKAKAGGLPRSLLMAAKRSGRTKWRRFTTDGQYTFYRCKKCNFQAAYLSATRYHVITHTRYRPYSCLVCGFQTNRHTNIVKHVKKYHGSQLATVKDGVRFDDKLMNSIVHELDENIFVLDMKVAKDGLGDEDEVEAEANVSVGADHNGLARFRCIQCGYVVVGVVQNIRQHCLKHSGYKPYSCLVCNHTCATHGALRSHIQFKHEGVNPQSTVQVDKELLRRIRPELDQMYVTETKIFDADTALREKVSVQKRERVRRMMNRGQMRAPGLLGTPYSSRFSAAGTHAMNMGRFSEPIYRRAVPHRDVGVGTSTDELHAVRGDEMDAQPLISIKDIRIPVQRLDLQPGDVVDTTGMDELDEEMEEHEVDKPARVPGKRGKPPGRPRAAKRPSTFETKELVEVLDEDGPTGQLDDSVYQCKLCQYRSKIEAAIDSHVRKNHFFSLTPYSCSLCGFKAPESLDIRKHISISHQVGSQAKPLVDEELRSSLSAVVRSMYKVEKDVPEAAEVAAPAAAPARPTVTFAQPEVRQDVVVENSPVAGIPRSPSPARVRSPVAAAAPTPASPPSTPQQLPLSPQRVELQLDDDASSPPPKSPRKAAARPQTKAAPPAPQTPSGEDESSSSRVSTRRKRVHSDAEAPEDVRAAPAAAELTESGRSKRVRTAKVPADADEPAKSKWRCLQCRTIIVDEFKKKIVEHCIEKHVPKKEWPFSCGHCDYRHYEVSMLIKHSKTHPRQSQKINKDAKLSKSLEWKTEQLYELVS